MRLASPPSHAGSFSQLRAQIAELGVEAAECVLQIREARSVLNVQERATLDRADRDIPTPGELVVLERLVQSDAEAQGPKVSRFCFAHRRMHRIRRAPIQRLPAPGVYQLELGPQP